MGPQELLLSVLQCDTTVQALGVLSGPLKHKSAANALCQLPFDSPVCSTDADCSEQQQSSLILQGFFVVFFVCLLEKERKHTFLVLLGTCHSIGS